jgi:hypothetical protein
VTAAAAGLGGAGALRNRARPAWFRHRPGAAAVGTGDVTEPGKGIGRPLVRAAAVRGNPIRLLRASGAGLSERRNTVRLMTQSRTGPQGGGILPYPHTRNDCGTCRERDADVQVLSIGGEDYSPPGRRPALMCQGCLGAHVALRAIHLSGPGLDQPVAVTVTVAPGRR